MSVEWWKISFLIAVLAAGGCRREDVKEFTQAIPGLDRERATLIAKTLSEYTGIVKDELKFDLDAGTLSIRYDSMCLAKENIRQAIEGKIHEVLSRH